MSEAKSSPELINAPTQISYKPVLVTMPDGTVEKWAEIDVKWTGKGALGCSIDPSLAMSATQGFASTTTNPQSTADGL